MTDEESWLQATCARYGLRFMRRHGLAGKDLANLPKHLGLYRGDDELDFVRVKPFGRLGNNLIQVAIAICFAERNRIPEIRHAFDFLKDRFTTDSGVRVTKSDAPDNQEAQGLEQIFFYTEYIQALDSVSPEEFCAQFSGPLQQAFRIKPLIRPERRVVAHLRGGDAFRTDLPGYPHPYFVQPPLSFYQFAIRDAMDGGQLDLAHIVAEDLRNPVALPLIEWLAAQQIPFEFTSTDRDTDAALIMGGDSLIMGFSSFSEILALLSPVTSAVTLFRTSQRTSWLQAKFPSLKIVDCYGIDYIPTDNWQCSPEQLELLISYPKDNLFIKSNA